MIRRLVWALVLFLAVTLLTYVIFFLIPANPAQLAAGKSATQEKIAEVERFLGLDQPVHIQYLRFLKRLVLEQDLGRSFATRRSVNEIVHRAAPVTAWLVLGGTVITILISIPVGVLSALRPRTLTDRVTMAIVLVSVSVPSFFFGLVLAYLLAYKVPIFPITGYCDLVNPSTQCGGVVQWAYHMAMPWFTAGFLGSALYVRMVRANVMETMTEDYVRTARAKGAPESRVLRSHVLRNAMLTFVTILGLDIGLSLGGAVFIERVFGLPGLGDAALDSISGFDLPVTQGIVVFGTLAIIVANFFVDVFYAWIDPRIRIQ